MSAFETLTFFGSILGGIVAIGAAIAAKRSADAAQRQANSAEEQADSAATSAKAAVAQAESAQKSARISEAAFRTERLKIYQRAKQLLREAERAVDGAFTQTLWGGVADHAAHHCNTAVTKLDELAHLPVEPNVPFTKEIGEILDDCRKLFTALQDANFVIWDKEHVRTQAIPLQSAISARLLGNVVKFDETILADEQAIHAASP